MAGPSRIDEMPEGARFEAPPAVGGWAVASSKGPRNLWILWIW
jgi:hypothetical protein